MRRWNGWGDDKVTHPFQEGAVARLQKWVGPSVPPQDAEWEAVMSRVPPSRLPEHSLVEVEASGRLRHACGQSLPDWVAMRSGRFPTLPDGVAYPTTSAEVRALLGYAKETGATLIPYGGGTSVVGHVNPLPGDNPVLTVDMGRMNWLQQFDEESLLATFGAGVAGPELEAQLRARGYALGHYPQSFEFSTLGGWVATRSTGQQSLGFGRIEQLFVGGRLEAPAGVLVVPDTFPASAAGPDLREVVLGSEGRLGILTEVTVRARPAPEREYFHAVFFPDFDRGREGVRAMVQADLPLSMLRLSTAEETETTLALAGHERLIGALEKMLALRGVGDDKVMLLLGLSGRAALVRAIRREALGIASDYNGVHVGRAFGNEWSKSRFRTPYLRNTLWEMGYAVDTLETATSWDNVLEMITAIETALRNALADEGERLHAFTHLSHMYLDGASVYTTILFRLAKDPDHTLARWQKLKTAASRAIVAQGGTISHQHGVGLDHAPYLEAEKGALGIAALRSLCAGFDPDGVMNPGKLVAQRSAQA